MVFILEAPLQFLLEASRNIHPNEFIGLLRGEDDTIREVIVLPASRYGEGFSSVRWMTVPIDKSIVGSVHSHPSGGGRPSRMDLVYFRKTGRIHLIASHPYEDLSNVSCFDRSGSPVDLFLFD